MSSKTEEAGDEAKISDGQAERALEKVKIYTDDGKTVSPIVRSEVYDGLFSLREWLEDRKKSGKIIDNGQDYAQAIQNIDGIQVFVTEKGTSRYVEALEKGELHFRDSIIRTYGSKENALKALKAAMAARGESDGNIGFNARAVVKEPTVFINIANYKKNKGHIELRPLSSLVLHEAAHAADLRFSENMVSVIGNKEVNPGVEYDAYKDSGMEIYARLMQMRKDLALDADKVFTLEDVAAMRRKCMEKRAAYEKRQKEKDNAAKVLLDGADALPGGAAVLSEKAEALPEETTVLSKEVTVLSEDAGAMPEQMKPRQDIGEIYDGLAPQDIDTMIFERYSDEQIMHLLNDVSDLDKPGNEAVKCMSRDALFDGMKRDFAMAAAGERVKTHIAREKGAVGNAGGTVVRQDTKQVAAEPEEKRTEKAAFDAAIWRGRNEKYYS